MPKQKQMLKAKKRSAKEKDQTFKTANEYLTVGVEHEEDMGKWRAGDAAKSARFFIRALEIYDTGLQAFPKSFDLAYNKARLQYDATQQPRILAHLPSPVFELLQASLHSHRYALRLEPTNADLLFNTAQVLSSVADIVAEGKHVGAFDKSKALSLLQEALELLVRCVDVQEMQFGEALRQESANMSSEENSVNDDSDRMSGLSTDDKWASIIEPVTKDSLVDSAIMQLEALTTSCSLIDLQHDNILPWIEEYSNAILQIKLPVYIQGTDRQADVAIARANFTCAYSDASFRCGRIDLLTYQKETDLAWPQKVDVSGDPRTLCDMADTSITFNMSVTQSLLSDMDTEERHRTDIRKLQWKYLSRALENLTAASKIQGALNLPRIYLRRGDCELLRRRLGDKPAAYDIALKSAPTLTKNAEVFYRGAASLAMNEGALEEAKEANVKEAVVMAILGNGERLLELLGTDREAVEDIVQDMREEDMLSNDLVSRLANIRSG